MKKQGTIRYGFNAGKALSKFMTLMMVIVFAASVPSKAEIPQGSLLNEVRCAACGAVAAGEDTLSRIRNNSVTTAATSPRRGEGAVAAQDGRLDCFASLAMTERGESTEVDNSHLTRISDFRAELSNRNSALSVQRGQFVGQVCPTTGSRERFKFFHLSGER